MNKKSHLSEILIYLALVLVLPFVLIAIISKVIVICDAQTVWTDAAILIGRLAVMVNVAVHPVPRKYNTASGEPLQLFPSLSFSGFGKAANYDVDEYDEGEAIPEVEVDTDSEVQESEAVTDED